MTTLVSRLAALAAFAAAALPWTAQAQNLPPLPEAIKAAGLLKAGVRCDQPPYGYKDETGKFAGVETDMAIQIAAWAFGSPDKIELTCVTAENRIPQLAGKKVDILIATLGITPERARVIDFSKPYRWGGSDMLVAKDSPIKKLDDVAGKTVIMLKGSTQAKWFEDNMPKLEGLRLNTASDALQALKQGRGTPTRMMPRPSSSSLPRTRACASSASPLQCRTPPSACARTRRSGSPMSTLRSTA